MLTNMERFCKKCEKMREIEIIDVVQLRHLANSGIQKRIFVATCKECSNRIVGTLPKNYKLDKEYSSSLD